MDEVDKQARRRVANDEPIVIAGGHAGIMNLGTVGEAPARLSYIQK
jgi:hypothetical protein